MSGTQKPPAIAMHRATQLEGHHCTSVCDIVAMTDCQRVATASLDEFVRVYDMHSGTPLHSLGGHKGYLLCLADLGGDLLASGGMLSETMLRIWDTASGVCLNRKEMGGDIYGIATLGEGKFVVSAYEQLVFLSHSNGRQLLEFRRIKIGRLNSFRGLAVGNGRIITWSRDQVLRIMDANSGSLIQSFPESEGCIAQVAVRDDLIAVATESGSVRVYCLGSLKQVQVLSGLHDGRCLRGVGIHRTKDDEYVVITVADDDRICVTSLDTGVTFFREELGFSPMRGRIIGEASFGVAGVLIPSVEGGRAKIFPIGLDGCGLSRRKAPKRSVVEDTLRDLLTGRVQSHHFTVKLLVSVLVRQNIESAVALFCAHNLLLLAIRCGVLNQFNIHSLGEREFFIMEEVYFPVFELELSSSEKALASKVLAHAEAIGIVPRGLDSFKPLQACQHDLREEGSIWSELSKLVENVRGSSAARRTRNKTPRSLGSAPMRDAVTDGLDAEGKRARDAARLRESFSKLRRDLEGADMLNKYRSIMQIVLSVIPILQEQESLTGQLQVGASKEISSEALVEIYFGHQEPGVLKEPTGSESLESNLDHLGLVDASSFTAARRLLSARVFNQFGQEVANVLMSTIAASSFKSFEALSQALEDACSKLGPGSSTDVGLLDVCDRSWVKSRPSALSTVGGSTDPIEGSEIEKRAARRFRHLTGEEGCDDIRLDDACNELLPLLFREGHQGTGDSMSSLKEQVFDALEAACGEDSGARVNEASFVAAFQKLCTSFNLASKEGEESHPAFGACFDKAAGAHEWISVRAATRAVWKLFKDRTGVQESALDEASKFPCKRAELTREEILAALRVCSGTGPFEKVRREGFVRVCRHVFYKE